MDSLPGEYFRERGIGVGSMHREPFQRLRKVLDHTGGSGVSFRQKVMHDWRPRNYGGASRHRRDTWN